MISLPFHPAALELLRLQSRGRRRRLWQRFRQKRRLVLSLVAGVLAVIWLGNAVMTVWLRESASLETLRALLSWGFVLYATWHLAKAAFFRPEHPFEWTDAERETLLSMPLRPRDLVGYQLASVTVTTIVKTVLFGVLLLPDLRCLPLAFVGLLLAMLLLEFVRMIVDLVTWGLSRRAYIFYRAIVVAGLVAAGVAVWVTIARSDLLAGKVELGDGVLDRFLAILKALEPTTIGYAALPFRPFVDLITATAIDVHGLALAAASSAFVLAMGASIAPLYSFVTKRAVAREQANYAKVAAAAVARESVHDADGMRSLVIRVVRWHGLGPIVWRQLVGVRRQWGSVLTAMIAPAILAAAPCFVIAEPNVAFLATAGTLAFYTFLLLPTALRFDFRRDLDRLALLKGLPISASAVVAGQTLAPVIVASLFQAVVLVFAAAARSLAPQYVVGAMLVMLPLNVFVFALDNLIYLLYPYRVQQEGLEIFARTMLTFTAKGLFFSAGLGAMAVWGFVAAAMARAIGVDAYLLFTLGMFVGPAVVAGFVRWMLARAFERVDLVEDLAR
ncbi:MAG: hypothetical protein AB7G28_12945 [Pirellulales bacterium]